MFWILSAFLVLLFATGGASRNDVQSLIILRPVSIATCVFALFTLQRGHLARIKWLLASFLTIFVLALSHIIPLPPAVWQSLAGRQDLVEVDKLVGLVEIWRPLSLTPMNGLHALLSLFVPLAVLLMGAQLDRIDLYRLLPFLIMMIGISGILGFLQAIGEPKSALYFYRITNEGSAVGLFANRNHAATLLACLFPMLAVSASITKGRADEVRFRQLVSVAIAIALVPLILVTGSRSGLVTAAIGLAAAGLFLRPQGADATRGGKFNRIPVITLLGASGALIIGLLTFYFSRAQAIERLFTETSLENRRTEFWAASYDIFLKYFPWGSGSGSFVEAFQISEPTYLLDPTYLNRAHNDWLETAITFGLPGIIIMIFVGIIFIWKSYNIWFSAKSDGTKLIFQKLSSVLILIIVIASISDYPLRTPIMMGVLAIFSLWFVQGNNEY